jgi:peroxiredoxin
VLGPGDAVPDVQVWTAPREEAVSLRQVLGVGYVLLCFYVWDWSPT